MRDVDEQNTEARRVAIIEATARCLSRNGVAKTSIGDICHEAGMRSGHLYYYFKNKDAVLLAVLLHRKAETIDDAEHMFDGGDLASHIVDVHIEAERRRTSYGLTPTARVELQCYFSRHPHDVDYDPGQDPVVDAIVRATTRAIDDGRLMPDTDVDAFVHGVLLIWQGMSFTRLWPQIAVEDMRKAVRLLIEPRLVGSTGGLASHA